MIKSGRERINSALVINKKSQPKESIIYNTYWQFAAKRQEIFMRRFNECPLPWTDDPILSQYKFTNVYRASDRVSQYLIRNVIYDGSQEQNEIFFRIILFKTFNRISTWEFLKEQLGEISYKDFSFNRYNQLLTELMKNGIRIYSAAYIMASGRSTFGFERKHQNHLRLLEKMVKDRVPYSLESCKTMQDAYDLLLAYPTIGEFLAYQYVIDINYSELTTFSEMDFVKAGPGARNGISKCFESFGDYSFEDIISLMADRQSVEFSKLGLNFSDLWGRSLQLIDCQNIFCEVDKYSRVAYPDITGISNRKRIKQKYTSPNELPIDLFFPPKWNINHLIQKVK